MKTHYIVYYDRPYEDRTGGYSTYVTSKEAEEFSTLEKAMESAVELGKYYNTYITKADPIWAIRREVIVESLE